MDDNFAVPPLELEKPLPSEREATDTAFYAAAASKGNPVEDFHSTKMDLQTTGQSNYVENVKKQWMDEQDAGNKEAIGDVMADTSIHPDVKKAVLQNYAATQGAASGDLRDRYIQKLAANPEYSDTNDQAKRQDWVIANMQNRRAQMDYEQREYDLANNQTEMKSFLGGMSHFFQGTENTLGLISDEEYARGHKEYKALAEANPISAGLGHAAGLLGVAGTALVGGGAAGTVLGASAIAGFFQGTSKYAELNQTEGMDQETRLKSALIDAGMTSAQFALPIFKAAGYLKAIALNGGAGVALGELNTGIQNTVLQAFPELQGKQFDAKNMTVNAILGGLVGAVFGRKPIDLSVKPQIPPASPAATTAAANPQAAAKIAATAIKNPSSGLATSMGTDVGAIANDWALPKALPDQVATNNPDLKAEIDKLDESMKSEFNDFRFDPNVVSATKRDEDAARIIQVLKENHGAYYQQSNSVVNSTDNLFQGKMVFGPNGTDKFLTWDDVHTAAGQLANSIKQLPEAERGTLTIVGTGSRPVTTKKTRTITETPPITGEVFETMVPRSSPTLPAELSKASPRFGANPIKFKDDFSRVAYILANSKTKSASHDKYLEWAKNASGKTEAEIISFGKRVISEVKASPKGAEGITHEGKGFEGIGAAPIKVTSTRDTTKPPTTKQVVEEHVTHEPVGPFHLEWEWKKEYDDASMKIFGPDSIKVSVLGGDVSNFARGKIANLFFPTGRFGTNVEQGAMRGIERTARLESKFIDAFNDNIANTKHGKELNTLINDAEEQGLEFIGRPQISAQFPHLSKAQGDDLFVQHTYWRRMQHYFHNFANRQVRNKLVEGDMVGLYNKNGDFVGPASLKVAESDIKDIKTIWDFDNGRAIAYNPLEIKTRGLKVVRMANAIDEPGMKHEFGLVGGDHKLSILPNEVLPRIPGYSPRQVKEHFFVDMHPNVLTVNGLRVTDKVKLKNDYTKSIAAARNEREANKLADQARIDNPGHTITVRPDRQDSFGKVVTDYQVGMELFKNSRQRGTRLPSVNGPARIEDRLVSAISMVRTLSKMDAFRAWDDNFQKAFTKGFGKFLDQGQFPQYKTDIKSLKNMGRDEAAEFNTAHRMFEYYSNMKNFETLGDHLWKKSMWHIADILEKWHVPAGAVRELGDKGNLLVNYPKIAATTAYIHLNPVRQWLIQPAQLMEMYAINPHTALPMFNEMFAVRMALTSNATLMKPHAKMLKAMTRQLTRMAPKEFDETIEAIEKSGLLQSIDMNVLVHGIFKEVDRNLLEGPADTAARRASSFAKALPRASRAVGFDLAELTNRVGLYLQAKELWKQQNPGKDWRTKENKETIAAEGLRLSGVMNKAGNLPYQRGALAVLFQFAAINQKLLMNLFQDNATIMTAGQRARLAAVRLGLYGAKYGLPGGAIIYALIDRSDNEDIKANADVLRSGIIDRVSNGLIASIVDPDTPSDVAVAKSLTPYSEGFLPYLDVLHESWKIFDDKPAGPRYPAISIASSFGKAIDQAQGWFITREVNEQNFTEMAAEVAEIASGFNNYSQGLAMLGMKDKVTSNGNPLGMQYSAAEAYAKMLGFQSHKEIDAYEVLNIISDKEKGKREMAKDIHKGLMNVRTKIGEEEFDRYGERLNAFMSMLDGKDFTEADKQDVMNEIVKLDRKSYTTIKQSIFADMWKYNSDQQTSHMTRAMDILRRSKDQEVQDFVKQLDEGKL